LIAGIGGWHRAREEERKLMANNLLTRIGGVVDGMA
jgi:hypothetical protein